MTSLNRRQLARIATANQMPFGKPSHPISQYTVRVLKEAEEAPAKLDRIVEQYLEAQEQYIRDNL